MADLVSGWLEEGIDSHSIYGLHALEDIPAPVVYDAASDRLVTRGKSVELGSMTIAEMRKRQGAFETGDPKGAFFPDDVDETERVFSGYVLSARLDALLTGEDAGGIFFGRGSAHRARIAHLKAAGF